MRGQKGTVVRKGASYFIKYRGPDGKQKMQGSAPGHGFRTEAEAKERLHEVLNDINKGNYLEPKRITFAFFAEQWIQIGRQRTGTRVPHGGGSQRAAA